MKTNFTKLTLIAALSVVGATSVYAESANNWPPSITAASSQQTANQVPVTALTNNVARAEEKQIIDLKDGSTIHVFNDGKMAMETKFGHAVRMGQGTAMETKDGHKITMRGDEVAHLNALLNAKYGRGN
jgi:hypothetical protein